MSRARRASLLDEAHTNRTPDVSVVTANLASLRERTVPLAQIDLLPGHNPRVWHRQDEVFGEAALAGLAASVRARGVIQPLLVRPQGVRFELVAGERRYHAARQAGLTEVPVRVLAVADEDLLEYALVENVQRRAMDPVNETYAVLDYLARRTGLARDTELPAYLLRVRNGTAPDVHGVTETLTVLGGWSLETWARSRVRILAMTDAERLAVMRGRVPLGVAGELTLLPVDRSERAALLAEAETGTLGVREVRVRVRAALHGADLNGPDRVDPLSARVTQVRARLTPREVAALPPRRRAKVEKLLNQLWDALEGSPENSR